MVEGRGVFQEDEAGGVVQDIEGRRGRQASPLIDALLKQRPRQQRLPPSPPPGAQVPRRAALPR
eukprot:257882-Chlamydomonas_euryale.AAC.4